MRLLLWHPGLARFSCGDCQRFVYDLETGERETICAGTVDCIRVVPPPCDKCPKGHPDREAEFKLSTKNLKTLRLYHEVRATAGACLTECERADRVLTRNLQTIDRLVREHEQQRATREVLDIILKARTP